MKYIKGKVFIVSLLAYFLIWACKNPIEKIALTPSKNTKDSTTLNNNKIAEKCNLVAYSDSLIFLKNQPDDYKIEPLQRRDGEYGSIPEGLEINESNGEINVTKSETGLRYKVFFIPKNTNDTCFTSLVISGIDYLSKIYILDQGDTLAVPIYNSNSLFTIPGGRKNADSGDGSSGSGISGSSNSGSTASGSSGSGTGGSTSSGSSGSGSSGSGNSGSSNSGSSGSGSSSSGTNGSGSGSSESGKKGGSEFDDDEDDDNGDGIADEPLPGQQVIPQGVAIDKANGKIELKKSLRTGLFGTNPTNGSNKKFKIYYRLDDQSGKALNAIEVQFHYYATPADVPNDLKKTIAEKNVNSSKGKISALQNLLMFVRKPRPPDIVIVGRYQ